MGKGLNNIFLIVLKVMLMEWLGKVKLDSCLINRDKPGNLGMIQAFKVTNWTRLFKSGFDNNFNMMNNPVFFLLLSTRNDSKHLPDTQGYSGLVPATCTPRVLLGWWVSQKILVTAQRQNFLSLFVI